MFQEGTKEDVVRLKRILRNARRNGPVLVGNHFENVELPGKERKGSID